MIAKSKTHQRLASNDARFWWYNRNINLKITTMTNNMSDLKYQSWEWVEIQKEMHEDENAPDIMDEFKEKEEMSTMTNLIKWQVWVTRDSKPIIMSLPFNNVNNAQEFLTEQFGKRIASISKL